jgi:hypothetical protein
MISPEAADFLYDLEQDGLELYDDGVFNAQRAYGVHLDQALYPGRYTPDEHKGSYLMTIDLFGEEVAQRMLAHIVHRIASSKEMAGEI